MNARQLVMFEKRKQLAAAKPRNKLRRPPVWLHPMALEREYAQELLKYVNFMEETARAILFPALPGLVAEAEQNNPVHADGYAENLENMIRVMSLQIDKESPYNWNTKTMDIGQKTSKWNSAQWQKTIKQVMGVNAAQYEPWIQDQLNSFSKENVALITSLKDKALTSIESNAQRAIRTGKRHEEIAKEIEDEFGATRSRAKLIARDQVSKLNGQLTQMRQKDVGIKEYIWRTSGDERVRASHAIMDGKKCRWDDASVYWNGTDWVKRNSSMYVGHPGSDYQCRCWAEPVFDSVYEAIDNEQPLPISSPALPETVVPFTPSGLTKVELEEKLTKKYGTTDSRQGKKLLRDGSGEYYYLTNDNFGYNTGFRQLFTEDEMEIAAKLRGMNLPQLPIEKVALNDLTTVQPTVSKAKVMDMLDLKWMNQQNHEKPIIVYYQGQYGVKKVVWDGNHRVVAARAQNIRKIDARVVYIKSNILKASEEAEAEARKRIPALRPGFSFTTKVATPEVNSVSDFRRICMRRDLGDVPVSVNATDPETLKVIAERMTWYKENFNIAVKGYRMETTMGKACASMNYKNEFGIGTIKDYQYITKLASRQQDWWPEKCNTLKSIIDHEMGHAIHHQRITQKAIKELEAYRNSLSDKEVKDGLSKYALSPNIKEHRIHEFIAEGWAEYTNNPSPRPIAKKIGEIIMKGWKAL